MKKYICFAMLSLALVPVQPVQAVPTVLFDNITGGFNPLDPGGSQIEYTPLGGGLALTMAIAFDVSGTGLFFDSVRMALSHEGGADNLEISLRADSGGNTPGPSLETLSLNDPAIPGPSPLGSTYDMSSTLQPALVDGNRYWFVFELTSSTPSSFTLHDPVPNPNLTHRALFYQGTGGMLPDPSVDPFIAQNNSESLAFMVLATPEPSTFAFMFLGLVFCGGRYFARKRRNAPQASS